MSKTKNWRVVQIVTRAGRLRGERNMIQMQSYLDVADNSGAKE